MYAKVHARRGFCKPRQLGPKSLQSMKVHPYFLVSLVHTKVQGNELENAQIEHGVIRQGHLSRRRFERLTLLFSWMDH
jgi:hypothetical protein